MDKTVIIGDAKVQAPAGGSYTSGRVGAYDPGPGLLAIRVQHLLREPHLQSPEVSVQGSPHDKRLLRLVDHYIVDLSYRRSMRNLVYDVRRYYHAVAPFLETELRHRGDERFWRQLGCQYAGSSILEIGCGTGRTTTLLAAAGARVVGVDVCPELMERASKRLRAQPVQLVLADMRELAFRAPFDLIVAPDDPFSHLLRSVDRDRALKSIARCLAPDGRLILDALWFGPLDERLGSEAGFQLDREVAGRGRDLHVIERWECNPRSRCCSTDFVYDDGEHEPTQARFRARYWTMAELSRRLQAAGLQTTAMWDGYDGKPWVAHDSAALVVEAKLAGP